MIEFETFEADIFWFTASQESDWIEDHSRPFGGWPGEDYIKLSVAWNDFPTVIGRYPVDVELEHLKAEGARWLLVKLDEWRTEALKLFPDRFFEQARGVTASMKQLGKYERQLIAEIEKQGWTITRGP